MAEMRAEGIVFTRSPCWRSEETPVLKGLVLSATRALSLLSLKALDTAAAALCFGYLGSSSHRNITGGHCKGGRGYGS